MDERRTMLSDDRHLANAERVRPARGRRVLSPLTLGLALVIVVTLGVALLALRVSADESVSIGTEADRIYVADGFYDPEQSAENGAYRWSHPLGIVVLPNWGPGRIHVRLSGVGVRESEALLKVDGVAIATTSQAAGQPWTLEAWGDSARRDPQVTFETPGFTPSGDKRELGLLVKTLEIYAPDARLRALGAIALLGVAGGLLYFLLLARGALDVAMAAVVGAALPGLLGPLAAFRDPWAESVAWVVPPAVGIALALAWWRRGSPARVSARWAGFFAVLSLSLALFLLYLGYMNAFDSDRMYQVAAGIWEYGRPTRYPGYETWTKYGFGQPLIAVPFYLLGKAATMLGAGYDAATRWGVSLTNLPVTALTCWLLYKAARRLASGGVAFAVAATYLLATPALNYARTFFSEPAGGALLLGALLLILPEREGEMPRLWKVVVAGVLLGSMILFKPAFAVYIPAPGLAVLWLALRGRFTGEGLRRALAAGAAFAAGPLAALAVQAGYNYIRYAPLANALTRTGYEKEPGFSTPLLEGLFGLLLSPGKSIFLYAPPLLLMPLGLWLMWRHGGASAGRLAAVLIGAEIAAGFVFNAMWWAWTGNFAWGPRLIVPVLPLMAWPLAMLPEALRGAWAKRAVVWAWGALAGLGAVVSVAGAMVDFQVYYRLYGLYLAGEPGESVTLYNAADSPLLVEPRYMLDGLTAAVHRPSLASMGASPIWDLLLPAVLVLLALGALWAATTDDRRPTTETTNH